MRLVPSYTGPVIPITPNTPSLPRWFYLNLRGSAFHDLFGDATWAGPNFPPAPAWNFTEWRYNRPPVAGPEITRIWVPIPLGGQVSVTPSGEGAFPGAQWTAPNGVSVGGTVMYHSAHAVVSNAVNPFTPLAVTMAGEPVHQEIPLSPHTGPGSQGGAYVDEVISDGPEACLVVGASQFRSRRNTRPP